MYIGPGRVVEASRMKVPVFGAMCPVGCSATPRLSSSTHRNACNVVCIIKPRVLPARSAYRVGSSTAVSAANHVTFMCIQLPA